jgi:aminopeptidase N
MLNTILSLSAALAVALTLTTAAAAQPITQPATRATTHPTTNPPTHLPTQPAPQTRAPRPTPTIRAPANNPSYRAAAKKIKDLIHTKLAVRFDYNKRYLYGKAEITLQPHFYPVDTLQLDAKGMDIHLVKLITPSQPKTLPYTYDTRILTIHLDRTYHRHQPYTILIEYTAKPYELTFDDNSLAKYNRGLYFVNPDSSEPGKPVQIYTQGETENSSVWFPTIDKPDQKTTSEIAMTVPAKYTTLSNGRLASAINNSDGTRTDTWKMDLPQPPYLFMMAVGDFKVCHDHWRNIPVDYYLEPKYAPYARQIFGTTPEMIEFFSKTLHYDFPWNKYAQVVVRDYASGGMENTTATLLNEYVQRTPRQLLDAYYDKGQSTIVHELFHQWFGALVTCKSWSNQSVDETFAEFSDVLWAGHKYGRDEADAHRNADLQGYLKNTAAHTQPIVRYHYRNELDLFDVLTYFKGNCVLNMLRNFLGDSAFYNGLGLYLRTNAFKNADLQQLRLALEETSGIDLTWFFDQWYYRPGHPELDITRTWDETAKRETLYIRQTQTADPFTLPVAIDIYAAGNKHRHTVWLGDRCDTVSFPAAAKPDLVDFDADKTLVATINENKTLEEFAFQYANAPLYLDRLEAIDAAIAIPSDPIAATILIAALKDNYYGLRMTAIHALDLKKEDIFNAAAPTLADLARNDRNTLSRAAAITALGNLKRPEYAPIFKIALTSESIAVATAAADALR